MSPLGEARKAVRELIRDYERRMYMSSYESECLDKLRIVRRGLYTRRRKCR